MDERNAVTVVGSYNVGLFLKGQRLPEIGETIIGDKFWEGPGGKGSNQAIAAACLGAPTRFMARIGNDTYGASALALYRRFGMSTDLIQVDSRIHSGISVILVDSEGRNMISVVPGANYHLCEEDIDLAEGAIRDSMVVAFQLENRLEVIDYAIRKAHQLGVQTLLDPAPARRLSDDLYPCLTYIKPNETEASLLTGIMVRDLESAATAGRWLLDRGARHVVITMGKLGAVLVTREGARHFPAPRVDARDTTGAGDIFSGAMLAALAEGRGIEAAITFANQAAALSVTRLGVIDAIPSLDEICLSLREGVA